MKIGGFLDARMGKPFDPMDRPMTYCFIADIAVAAAHRSLGIGQQLMHAAEDWGRNHGARFMSLKYHVANQRAAALYERIGCHDPRHCRSVAVGALAEHAQVEVDLGKRVEADLGLSVPFYVLPVCRKPSKKDF